MFSMKEYVQNNNIILDKVVNIYNHGNEDTSLQK
jgi:hypothetical protein